jgi:phosphatidylglycerophosphate synthase
MTGTTAAASAPLAPASAGVRFLGLDLAERNRRVVARSGRPDGRLEIPPGVAITRSLAAALPAGPGAFHLVWRDRQAPLLWTVGPGGAPVAVRLPEGAAVDVSTAAARRRAAWQLLKASGKPTDGWQSRHVHRPISRLFSYALLQARVSANVATFLTFGVGALASWYLAQTSHATMIAGTLLFWFASIADGIDGEMARLTLSESAWGEQLDTAVDHATHLLGFAGVLVGWWRQGIGAPGVALAIAVAAAIPGVLLWAMAIVRRATGSDQFFVDTKPIEFAVADGAAATGSPILALASWVFVLFRREAFCLTFFLMSLLTGRRAVFPAAVAMSLAAVGVVFVAYRGVLDRALRARWAR